MMTPNAENRIQEADGLTRLRKTFQQHQAGEREKARLKAERAAKAREKNTVTFQRKAAARNMEIFVYGEEQGEAWAREKADFRALAAIARARSIPETAADFQYPSELTTDDERGIYRNGFAQGAANFYITHRAEIVGG